MADTERPLSLVVLISGRGSNLKAILRAIDAGRLRATVKAVISSRADADGLRWERAAAIDTLALDGRDYPRREDYDRALLGLIERFAPDLVLLAGFMRILSAGFVRHFRGRLLNIHPSLLPALRGLRTHQRAIAEGLREHGASVHYVTEELDSCPVIIQARVPVLSDDSAETLAARVLQQEHELYVRALQLIATGEIRWNDDGRVYYRDGPLPEPLKITGLPDTTCTID